MFDTFFVLPYEEDDEFFVGDQLLNLLRKKPVAPPPKPEVGSVARPYVWSYILSQKRDSRNTHSHNAIEGQNSFSIIDKPLVMASHANQQVELVSQDESKIGSPLPQIRPLSPSTSISARDGTSLADQDQVEQNSSSISDDSIKKIDNSSSGLRISLKDSMWVAADKDRSKYQEVRDTVSKLCNQQHIITQMVSSPIKKALPVPYHEQGSMEMYSIENLGKRLELKEDETIRGIIGHWWNATVKSKNQPDVITKIVYMSLVMAVYTIMMPDDAGKTLEDARRNAEKDWKVDARGRLVMDFILFYDAIFELADVWCETTQKREYVLFLDVLFQKVFMDLTLPKVIRRHVDHKYIASLVNKKREKRLNSSPSKIPRKRTNVKKRRDSSPVIKKKKSTKKVTNEVKEREPIVPEVVITNIDQQKSTTEDIYQGNVTLDSDHDSTPISPEVSVSTEVPVVIVKPKELNSIGTQTPRSVIDKSLDDKLQSIIEKLKSDELTQQKFLNLLRQNDKFILERTIFTRMLSDIKNGQKSSRGFSLLNMLNQNIISDNYQKFMRVGDKINLKELLSIIIHLSQDDTDSVGQSNSILQGSFPRDTFKKQKSMTTIELTREREEYIGRTKPKSARQQRGSTADISSVLEKLSQSTWGKLLQFAEFLIDGDENEIISVMDKMRHCGEDKRQLMTPEDHFRNRVYEDALERYMDTDEKRDITNQTLKNNPDERRNTRSILTREDTLRELFKEAEKLKSTDTYQERPSSDLSIQFSDSPREGIWSAFDFFQNNIDVEGEDSDWWEKETSNDSIYSQANSSIIEHQLERRELRYNYDDVTDLFPEDKEGAEELKEVVKRLSMPLNRFYPISPVNVDMEYKVPKKAQKNFLFVAGEPEQATTTHRCSFRKRNSWFPDSSNPPIHVSIPRNITAKSFPEQNKSSNRQSTPKLTHRFAAVETSQSMNHSPKFSKKLLSPSMNRNRPRDALELIERLPPDIQRRNSVPSATRNHLPGPVQVSKLSSKYDVYQV